MDKLYRVTLTLPNGKRKFYSGATKKEAELKRDKAKAEMLLNGVDVGDSTTVKSLAETWYSLYKESDASLHTRSKETIRNVLNRYILPDIGRYKVREVKPMHIQHLMSTVSGMSLSTQRKVIQYTRAIFTVAVDNGIITRNPATSNIKPSAEKPAEEIPLTDSECEQLLKATLGTRAYPFLMVLRFTGLRKGEALGLMWSDIDFDRGVIKVRRSLVYTEKNRAGELDSRMKTENAKRDIPMIDELINVLKEEKAKSKSAYVFSMKDGSYLSESSFRKLWEIIGRRNLPFSVHPHQLRHTCITAWLENGLDIKEVQYLAGHSSANITMNIYAHYRESQRREDTANKIRNSSLNFAIA